MIAIVCVDDKFGTMFNNRRQSRDCILIEKLMAQVGAARLWMRAYSAELFGHYAVTVNDMYLQRAGGGEYCFVEGDALLPYVQKLEGMILFRWNRAYPSDRKLDIALDAGWILERSEVFAGSSHPEIQMDIYRKVDKK